MTWASTCDEGISLLVGRRLGGVASSKFWSIIEDSDLATSADVRWGGDNGRRVKRQETASKFQVAVLVIERKRAQ